MNNISKKTIPIEEYDALKQEYEEFTYIVSHDFNAPMRHLREFSKLLVESLDGKISDKEKMYVGFIEKSVLRNQAMLEALLQLSRLNTDAGEYITINCNDIVADIIKHKAKEIEEAGAEITYSDLPLIHGEATQIKTLFYNLIDNALKFRRKDFTPLINITAEQNNEFWLFCIEDNGIGIEKSMENKIFKLFRKLNADDEYSGVGIGLTLAKKITEVHGGKLWVECEQQKRSKFFFTLSAA